ncbi:MAG: 4Fe-4S dicluster domain-containing protein [Pirellulales bacterium]|jgi:Na+-translocating ferredoxin:NAD+ oxidoreductase RnfC subunit|nr:4Fe-4S dicluster domain-containing protein [Thermoguttaceae bacterium]MDD4786267.1 4Fe-4S dicluster domain-containing protein [Pirellulales bacterium]MDI9445261.1 4Fe-4S dicluster domain-containing protein [Planctomycetota bacterium]NLZ00630.1 NADH dehydrogenase subunit [Pirellulaceae bacterium]
MTKITQEMIAEAGVVGAGGAGFPTHVKLAGKADTVVINAAECEPLLHKDKEVLRREADGVIAGLADAMHLVGAARGVVGIKGKYTDVIEVLQPKLAGNMQITPLADAYPSGDEFILVYETLGRVIPPGAIPLAVGAVVMNVETALNVARAVEQPVTEKYLSVAGAVAEPVTLRVPVGVTLAECVAAAGGATIADPNYVVGGVMMGYLEDNHQALVDKTTGGVIVLPGDHVVVRRRRQTWQEIVRIGRSACDQCSFCTELCPRWLLGHPIEPHRAMRSLEFNLVGEANVIGTSFCCECNLCSLYSCPEDLDPKNVCTQNKRRLIADKRRWENPPFNPRRPELHMENRKAPTARLMQKLGLRAFRNVGPMVPELLEAQRVGIKLKQHIGAACEPAVAVGQAVAKGQVVGRRPSADGKPALGAPVHASISGTVTEVRDGVVWIERGKS